MIQHLASNCLYYKTCGLPGVFQQSYKAMSGFFLSLESWCNSPAIELLPIGCILFSLVTECEQKSTQMPNVNFSFIICKQTSFHIWYSLSLCLFQCLSLSLCHLPKKWAIWAFFKPFCCRSGMAEISSNTLTVDMSHPGLKANWSWWALAFAPLSRCLSSQRCFWSKTEPK